VRLLRGTGRSVVLVVLWLVAAMLVSCSDTGVALGPIYADGSRGCREAEHDVAIWSMPGAVPGGAEVVAEVTHGARLTVLAEEIAFGVRYYEVEWEGQRGWLPELYSETIPPVCE